jgi:hypothetical protein
VGRGKELGMLLMEWGIEVLIGNMVERRMGLQGCCEGGRAGRIKARPGGGGAQNWGWAL